VSFQFTCILCSTRDDGNVTRGLKHDGTDGMVYTDGTAGLVADGTDYKDGTEIQLLVEQTEQPLQTVCMERRDSLYRRDSYVDV